MAAGTMNAEQAADLVRLRAYLATLPDSEAKREIESEYVLKLILRGWSYRAAASALSLSTTTAHRRVQAALAARTSPLVDRYRELANARCDEMVKVLGVVIDSGEASHADRIAAVRAWVAVEARRAAALGSDAPVRADLNVRNLTEDTESELQAMIDAAKAEIRREQAAAGHALIEGGSR